MNYQGNTAVAQGYNWSGLRDVPYGDDMIYPDVGLVATIPTLEPGAHPQTTAAAGIFGLSGNTWIWVAGAAILLLILMSKSKGRR